MSSPDDVIGMVDYFGEGITDPYFMCPGCNKIHRLCVSQPDPVTARQWSWNKDLVNPTFTPTVKIEHMGVIVCVSTIINGTIAFLGGNHRKVGLSMKLPEISIIK